MIPVRRSSKALVVVGLGILYVVWGTTYLAIRIAVESIPPFLLAAVTFTLAGPVLFGIVALRSGLPEGWPPPRQWLSAVLVGIGLVTFGNGALNWGEQYVPSGIAAIVVATVPLWLALLARAFLGERLRWPAMIGLGLGFTGLVILVAPTVGRIGDLAGLVAVLLTAVGWAAGSVYSKRAPLPADPFQAAGMQMFCGGLVTLALAFVAGDAQRFDLGRVSPSSKLAFVYLLLAGAILAFGVYQWLVRNASLAVVGTYAYVNPIVAVGLGAIILGEPITPRAVIAGVVIVVGVALIVAAQTMGPPAHRELAPIATTAPEPTHHR